jgi:hypothetical protein
MSGAVSLSSSAPACPRRGASRLGGSFDPIRCLDSRSCLGTEIEEESALGERTSSPSGWDMLDERAREVGGVEGAWSRLHRDAGPAVIACIAFRGTTWEEAGRYADQASDEELGPFPRAQFRYICFWASSVPPNRRGPYVKRAIRRYLDDVDHHLAEYEELGDELQGLRISVALNKGAEAISNVFRFSPSRPIAATWNRRVGRATRAPRRAGARARTSRRRQSTRSRAGPGGDDPGGGDPEPEHVAPISVARVGVGWR